jgi:hypothetical protein
MMLYTACSTISHLAYPDPAPPWQFDTASALIGAAIALVLVGLAYYLRGTIRQSWEAIVDLLAQLSQRLEASAEDRYRERVVARARSTTVLAHGVPLDAVFVEPTLLTPTPLSESRPEIDALIGPRVLPLRQTLGEHPRLAILGTCGAGKTTLLAYVALACARAAEDSAETEATPEPVPDRLPLYVLLSAMDWNESDGQGDTEGAGEQGNPVERLISAAVTAVEGSRGMMNVLRERLEAGQAVVLVDGWDELLPPQRQRAAAWLSELIDEMPGNLWLVGAEPRGHAPLTEAGFVSLRLTAWDVKQVGSFARQWVAACLPTDADSQQSTTALRELTDALQYVTRAGASPLELALRAFVYLSDGQMPAKRALLFDHALDLQLQQEKEEKPWLPAACRSAFERIALDLQQQERTTAPREEIEAAIESALPLPEEVPARAASHAFRAMTDERGLLRPTAPNRYSFVHPLWQAYLAARQVVAFNSPDLVERLDDPHWAEVLRFYAEIGDMGPLVSAWLRSPDDMFRTRLRTLSTWIKAAPEDADWRDGAMAILARSFLQSSDPTYVRQKLAESLAATDVAGITYLFKQALRHPDAGMRTAAVMGLTKTAKDSDLPALEAALADEDPRVREATIRGLAQLGTDAATRWLARIFLEGDEALSTAAAEALAQCGKEGADFLREAVESEDTIARRAAVFGLAQIGARDLLQQVAREDEQWIVRSAAVTALDELERQEKTSGVAPPPEIEQLPWLISWAATKGEGVGLGDAARRMLRRALSEGDAPTRLAAAQVLAQVGRPDDVEPLRKAMAAPDPDVASAAVEALAEISERYALQVE